MSGPSLRSFRAPDAPQLTFLGLERMRIARHALPRFRIEVMACRTFHWRVETKIEGKKQTHQLADTMQIYKNKYPSTALVLLLLVDLLALLR